MDPHDSYKTTYYDSTNCRILFTKYFLTVCPDSIIYDHPVGIIEGTSGTLTCNSTSSNPPVAMEWEKWDHNSPWVKVNSTHDIVIEDAEYNGKITSQKFTTDENIARYDNVHYRCCIRNAEIGCQLCRDWHVNIYCKLKIYLIFLCNWFEPLSESVVA